MVEQLFALGRYLGIPGLFALGLIDSGGIPTGGGPDLLLALLVVEHASLADALLMASAAVIGSSVGCLIMYAMGRYGGAPLLARFGADRVVRVRTRLHRHGPTAITAAVVAPPPYPMKLFILSAGVFHMPLRQFVISVLVGRSVRYLGLGLIVLYHGDAALMHMREYWPLWAFLLLTLTFSPLVLRWIVKRRRLARVASRTDVAGETASGPGPSTSA
jgi:membrane protein YqaA with SNARE-associated domain